MSKRIGKKLKAEVASRAHYFCEYCKSPQAYSPDPFCIDHIIPLSKNGTSNPDNLAFSCNGCNNSKYAVTEAIDPLTGKMVPLFHPRKDSWDENFKWSMDKRNVVGLSPTGRATVSRLRLNRIPLANQRELLTHVGKHPPVFS